MTLTQPIIVSPPETISFILCQENSTFFIGMMYNMVCSFREDKYAINLLIVQMHAY